MKKLMNDTYTCVDLSKILGQPPKRKKYWVAARGGNNPIISPLFEGGTCPGLPPQVYLHLCIQIFTGCSISDNSLSKKHVQRRRTPGLLICHTYGLLHHTRITLMQGY